jgi:hypothetical protein
MFDEAVKSSMATAAKEEYMAADPKYSENRLGA